MRPLRSVGGRLAFALLLVVAGVLTIVYLIVVPSYKTSLENNELSTLQQILLNRAVPTYPAAPWMKQQFASTLAPKINARVVVFNLQNETPALLVPYADSDVEGDSTDVVNDPVAIDAIQLQTLARGAVTRRGQEYAEVAYPIGASVVMLSAPLHDQLQVVSVVRKRVIVAGAIATAFAALLGYAGASIFARRIRRLEEAAERIAAGNFTTPVVDHGSDELGQLARTFERMRLRLANLDRARGEFIANASHELRTPLFSLGAFLELMDHPDLDEPTRDEFLGQMREQVARLTKLATDLLDLSRLDAGRLTVASELVELSELAEEVAAEFRGRAGEHTIEVAAEPVVAEGDAERVLQIGRILLENALVHTPPGTTVRISTAVDGGRATLTVANDGPAIPREVQHQVFERFYRLDGTRASGSGLGLAIARELAEVMGGRIELDSQNGWTLFTLVLSAEVPERDLQPGLV
ncbi:MAG TPA: HAMP domain-containing sensor histidine kinase [Gaiellaceae bacterium]|nr:HAMP domain-containing sensor histidine kinase [Gaiellaceae bacterium]